MDLLTSMLPSNSATPRQLYNRLLSVGKNGENIANFNDVLITYYYSKTFAVVVK